MCALVNQILSGLPSSCRVGISVSSTAGCLILIGYHHWLARDSLLLLFTTTGHILVFQKGLSNSLNQLTPETVSVTKFVLANLKSMFEIQLTFKDSLWTRNLLEGIFKIHSEKSQYSHSQTLVWHSCGITLSGYTITWNYTLHLSLVFVIPVKKDPGHKVFRPNRQKLWY